VRRKHVAAGANILVWRHVYERVGPFRNGRLPEDLEWGRRAHGKGYRIVFAADALVRHPARRTWRELRGKADRTVWHSRNYMGEQGSFRLRWLLYTAGLALPPIFKCWQVLTTPMLAGAARRTRAIRMLFRVRYYRVLAMLGSVAEDPPPGPAE
jgi:GT2 family glycosyltransferase